MFSLHFATMDTKGLPSHQWQEARTTRFWGFTAQFCHPKRQKMSGAQGNSLHTLTKTKYCQGIM